MDEVDRAQTEIEHALRDMVWAAGRANVVEATGTCLNCGEALLSGQRWCDSGCRDDWARIHPSVAGAR